MLYVTTRDNKDAFTAHRALTQMQGDDGGKYVPFRLPEFDNETIVALESKPFSRIMAEVLNTFFSLRFTEWDVDFCIGRNPVKVVPMNHRILVGELWHNLDGNYEYLVRNLYKKATDSTTVPTEWFRIAVRIAVLFGLYGEMLKAQTLSRGERFDVSVSTGDFSAPMAAWYARKMGLPVGTIICTHEDNSCVWDFIHRGTFSPVTATEELTLGMERLIYATLGLSAVQDYLGKVQDGRSYSVREDQLDLLSNGFFCCVAGKTRADSIINSVYRSNNYIVHPVTALHYGGLQDYRAKTGESRLTLLLADDTPLDQTAQICDATGIPADKLKEYVIRS